MENILEPTESKMIGNTVSIKTGSLPSKPLTKEAELISKMVVESTVSKYDYLCLKAGRKYYTCMTKVEMVAKKKSYALMIIGEPGVGKSETVRRTLNDLGLKEEVDCCLIKGHSTPMALYAALYEAQKKGIGLIIIDDCDSALKNSTSLDILKAALDDKPKRTIHYRTMRKTADLPTEFDFNGGVIFITNYKFGTNDMNAAALRDRCLVNEFILTVNEKLECIEKLLVPYDYKGTSIETRIKIFNLMKETVALNVCHFSFRTYFQLLDIYLFDPDKFGTIHLREMMSADTEATILLEITRRNPNNVDEQIDEFMARTRKSRRHFFYLKKKMKEFISSDCDDD